jgi:hypothetical protein
MRATDGGYAARFSGIFLALSFFRFDSESALQPTAANAHRWAAISPTSCEQSEIQLFAKR